MITILQSTQYTDREGGKALMGTTTEDRPGECEGGVQGGTVIATMQASRSITRRLSMMR